MGKATTRLALKNGNKRMKETRKTKTKEEDIRFYISQQSAWISETKKNRVSRNAPFQKKAGHSHHRLILMHNQPIQVSPMNNVRAHLETLVNAPHTNINPMVLNHVGKPILSQKKGQEKTNGLTIDIPHESTSQGALTPHLKHIQQNLLFSPGTTNTIARHSALFQLPHLPNPLLDINNKQTASLQEQPPMDDAVMTTKRQTRSATLNAQQQQQQQQQHEEEHSEEGTSRMKMEDEDETTGAYQSMTDDDDDEDDDDEDDDDDDESSMADSEYNHPAISRVELSPQTHIVDLNTDPNEPYILARIPLDVYHQIVKNLEQERNPRMIKGSWTAREDTLLLDLVRKYGPKRWSFIASHLKGRVGKQCRERYLNHLDPNINKSEWRVEEDHIIVRMQAQLGNKWAKIAKHLTGRTPNAVKNHWNSTLSKRAERIRQKLGVQIKKN